MKKVLKNELDVFSAFNPSAFNEENGITKSRQLYIGTDNIEVYRGFCEDGKYSYLVANCIGIKIMQGKTRSGISLHCIVERDGQTFGAWRNIKDLSKESGERVLNVIREYLNR